MAYQGLNLGDIYANAVQIKGAQQRSQLADLQIQQATRQQGQQQAVDALAQSNPNASLADYAKAGGVYGVEEGAKVNTAKASDLMNQYRQNYLTAGQVASAQDPIAAAQQYAPQFIKDYEQAHGQGSFSQLNPDQVRQLAAGVQQHAIAGLVDPTEQFKADQTHRENVYKQQGPGGEAQRAQMKIDAEAKQAAMNRAATAANDVKPVLNGDGSVTYVQANQAAGKNVGSTSGAIAGSITDQAKELAYQTFKTTGQMPAIGRGGAAVQAAYANYFAQRAAQDGDTGASIAAKGQAFKAQQGVLKDYTSGKTSQTLNGINTAVAHMEYLDPLIDKLDNTSSPLFNKAANYFKQQTGSTAPTNFAAMKDFVAGEVAKAVLPGGGGEGERQALSAPLAAANTPAQLKEAVQTIKTALAGKTEALRNQWDIGTAGSQGDFDKFLLPATKKALGHASSSAQSAGATPGSTLVIPANIQALLDKHK